MIVSRDGREMRVGYIVESNGTITGAVCGQGSSVEITGGLSLDEVNLATRLLIEAAEERSLKVTVFRTPYAIPGAKKPAKKAKPRGKQKTKVGR